MNILNNISLKRKLIAFALIFSIIPVVLMGVYAYQQAEQAISTEIQENLEKQLVIEKTYIVSTFENAQNKVNDDLKAAQALMETKGSPSIINGELVFGEDYVVNGNHEVVDNINSMLGDSATIFQVMDGEAIRVSTTNTRDDGSRATGTPVSQQVYDTVVVDGDVYYGRAWVVNEWHRSAYKPIKDISGNVVGILGIGVDEDPFWQQMEEQLLGLTVGETGYFYVMDSQGNLLIHPNSKGESVYDNAFIQEILTNKEGYVEYEWEGRDKVSAYTYYEPTDWYIASTAYKEEFTGPLDAIRNGLIAAVLIFAVIGLVIGLTFSKSITKPLDEVVGVANSVSEGNLAVTISNDSTDELGILSNSMRKMVSNLGKLVEEVQNGSISVSSAAEEMAATSQEVTACSSQISSAINRITEGAQSQYVKSDEIAKAMADMTSNTQSIAEKAQLAAETATTASNLIQDVGNQSENLISQMNVIQTSSMVSAEVIRELDQKSAQISEIVSIITSIADQTNLLALNAAIEAARAGEHGRGFAVVADEVRKLAENSGDAAHQISDLIGEIQEGTHKAVESVESSVSSVGTGVIALNETVAAVKRIVEGGGKVARMAEDIAAAAQEQSASIEEITASVEEVSTISQQSAAETQETSAAIEQQTASMEEIATSAQKLASLSEDLQDGIKMFKLGSNEAIDG
jgi:methyl-accepting chemotaxis protein